MFTIGDILREKNQTIEIHEEDNVVTVVKPKPQRQVVSPEERHYRKIRALQLRLREAGVYAKWNPRSWMFEIRKPTPSGYDYIMYAFVDMERNEFVFGGETEDMCSSCYIYDVIDAVVEWLNNDEPSCR